MTKIKTSKSKLSFYTPPLAGDEVQNCSSKFKIPRLVYVGELLI
jgi:hypothetical protein